MQLTFHIGDETFGPFDEATLRTIPSGVVRSRHRVSPDGGQTILPVASIPEFAFLLSSSSPEVSPRLRLERIRLRYETGWFSPPSLLGKALQEYRALLDSDELAQAEPLLDEVKGEILRLRRLQRGRGRFLLLAAALIVVGALLLNYIPKTLREDNARREAAVAQIRAARSLDELDVDAAPAVPFNAALWRRELESRAFVLAGAALENAERESEIEKTLVDAGRFLPAASPRLGELAEAARRRLERLRDPVFRLSRQLDAFLKDLGRPDELEPEKVDLALDRIRAFRERHPKFEEDLILEGRLKTYEIEREAAVARKFDQARQRLDTAAELHRGDYETIFREYDRFLRDYTAEEYPMRAAALADIREEREKHVREKAERDRREAELSREAMLAAVEDAWEALRQLPEGRYREFFEASERFLALPNPERRYVTEIRDLRAKKLVRWDEAYYGVFYELAESLKSDTDMEDAQLAAERYLETCRDYAKIDFPGKYRKQAEAWLSRLEEIRKDGAPVVFSVTRVETSGITIKDRGIQIAMSIDEKTAFASDWIPRDLKQPRGGTVVFTAIPANMTGQYKARWDPAAQSTIVLRVFTDDYGSAWRVTGFRNPAYEYSIENSRFPFIHLNTPEGTPLELKNKKSTLGIRVQTELKGLGFPALPKPNEPAN